MSNDTIKKANRACKISGKEHAESFNKIEPYLFELRNLNQGLLYKVERVDSSSSFKRLIIIPHYVTSILHYIYPVVGLDSAHMKTIVISNATQTSSRTLLEKLYITVLSSKLPGNILFTLHINQLTINV